MFTIKQKVINSTNNKYDFYSYGQIIRNKIPEGYLIFTFFMKVQSLTLEMSLIEEDYDDIQDQKFSQVSQKGWLGIGDKYWITSLIPPKKKNLKLHLIIKKI